MDDSKQSKQTRKDKRKQKLQKQLDDQIAEMSIENEKLDSTFSVSTAATNAPSILDNAIKVPSFSISAAGRDLIVNAELNITLGRRYGVVGRKKLIQLKLILDQVSNSLYFLSSFEQPMAMEKRPC